MNAKLLLSVGVLVLLAVVLGLLAFKSKD